MALHPQAQAIITGVESMGLPPFETLPVEEARALIQTFASFMLPSEEVASVKDHVIPGPEADIPLRVFTPEGTGLRPAVLYFHGGGFATGGIDLVDPLCRALANRSGCVVIAVGYRLAPEHPYPAAVMDAYIATAWVAAYGEDYGVDGSRLAVAGDSAGANLATVTCMVLQDKDDDINIRLQLLLCPVTDLVEFGTDSHKEFGDGYILTTGMMQWFKGHYLSGAEDRADEPYCSPVRRNSFAGLPPAIIVTAEYDPLRDEGEIYGKLLLQDDILVDIRREPGMIHNFFWMGAAIDRGREILDELGTDLSKTLYLEI